MFIGFLNSIEHFDVRKPGFKFGIDRFILFFVVFNFVVEIIHCLIFSHVPVILTELQYILNIKKYTWQSYTHTFQHVTQYWTKFRYINVYGTQLYCITVSHMYTSTAVRCTFLAMWHTGYNVLSVCNSEILVRVTVTQCATLKIRRHVKW